MYVGLKRVKEAKVQTFKTEFEAILMKNGELLDDFAMKLMAIVTCNEASNMWHLDNGTSNHIT